MTSSIAGACCGLPMPLVTSQTYVPASSDLIGEMIRAPSGWIVTRPWVRGYYDGDADAKDDDENHSDCTLFGWVGFADFMHDFNLETKQGFKIKTEAPEIKILSLQSNFKVLAYMRE